jgi:hypothetical protein
MKDHSTLKHLRTVPGEAEDLISLIKYIQKDLSSVEAFTV